MSLAVYDRHATGEAACFGFVKTTPQMTRFRDVKVCNNLATDEIDDHRIQSDYNMNCNIQKERTLHLVLRMRGEDSRHQ